MSLTPPTPCSSAGLKFDQGKPMMSLIDPSFLTGVAQVLTFGANKYGKHNWRNGIHISRLVDAALRHINAFNSGLDLDEESGLEHLYHATCCLMMASRFTNTAWDDRYVEPIQVELPPSSSSRAYVEAHLETSGGVLSI